MLRLRQLTHGLYGHTLNRRQVVSPDRQWVVYDTRNEDPKIPQTDSVEMVHIASGNVVRLYRTSHASEYGPGVGAVAFHPVRNRICFIHGLESCSAQSPYSAARRFGAILDTDPLSGISHAEPRWMQSSAALPDSLLQPDHPALRLEGSLSGGTHAHSWNREGWLSFTYNDAYLERWSKLNPAIRDVRSVGFMMPHVSQPNDWELDHDSPESFAGNFAAFLAVQLTPTAQPDTDQIDHALEECWLTNHQLAVQGAVRGRDGKLIYEVFRIDLPDAAALQGRIGKKLELGKEPWNRLNAVSGCRQMRLTRTVDRKFPGIQGPRNWLVGSPDGVWIYFPMKDDTGIVQLFRVSSMGGRVEQISHLSASLESQITLDPQGQRCSMIIGNRICIVDVNSGSHHWYPTAASHTLVGAVHFLEPERFLVNAYVGEGTDRFLQLFVCE
jgi:hypothetical protein